MENKKSYNFWLYIFFYRQETSAETKARKLRANALLQAAGEKNPASNEINIVTSNLKINKMNPGKLICWRHDEDAATLLRCFRHKVR